MITIKNQRTDCEEENYVLTVYSGLHVGVQSSSIPSLPVCVCEVEANDWTNQWDAGNR